MDTSPTTDFNAATDRCALFAHLSIHDGTSPVTLAEAMTQSGIYLLAREIGAAEAASYVLHVLAIRLREVSAHG